ncbi:unnamed protein product [Cuscuta campestris]|uniref:Ubiquitin-like protease family profile domain-containing protein n=1 Tax=Cuscuta campestris TaxID=132261 RepID=A0A484KFJ4_9ASTE|nr:unnamed protein product [Cuscuta campestris]
MIVVSLQFTRRLCQSKYNQEVVTIGADPDLAAADKEAGYVAVRLRNQLAREEVKMVEEFDNQRVKREAKSILKGFDMDREETRRSVVDRVLGSGTTHKDTGTCDETHRFAILVARQVTFLRTDDRVPWGRSLLVAGLDGPRELTRHYLLERGRARLTPLTMSLLIPVSAHSGAQYSVCSDIREAINNIEKKLSPSQFEEFHRTPIGHFMGLKNLQFSGQIIHQMLLLLVEDQPDDEFWILQNGGEVAKCTFKHVREKYVTTENTMDSKKMDSDADTVRAIRDLKKRMDGLEVKIDEIKKLLVEVVMNLNSSGRRRRYVKIQRQKRARTKAAEEDDEDLEEDDEIEEAAEEYEEETGADEDQEENAIGENEDTEQIEDEHTAVEKSHNDSDEDRAEKEGTAEHEPQDNMTTTLNSQEALPIPSDTHMFEVDSHMVEVDDKEGDDLDEEKLLMELTLNKNHLLRMSADEYVWSKDKFLSKFDWSGIEKIFLPVNGDGRHWLLAEIDLLRNQVRVYDSLKGPKSSFYVKEVVRRISPLLRTVKGVGANTLEKEWETIVVNGVPSLALRVVLVRIGNPTLRA